MIKGACGLLLWHPSLFCIERFYNKFFIAKYKYDNESSIVKYGL